MEFRWIQWNVDKVDSHGVTPDEAEDVVQAARTPYPQQRVDNKLLVRGSTAAGRLLQVIYVLDPDDTVFIIHARPLTSREKRQRRRMRRHRGLP